MLDLAKENGVVEEVRHDMLQFEEALSSAEFRNLLKSPIIKGDVKDRIVRRIFTGSWQPITLKFFEVVIRKDREDILDQMAETFFDQYNEYKGITVVKVISAQPLQPEVLKNIENKLLKSGKTRPNIVMNTETDPSLIGGFILEYNNNRYDASVKRKLSSLKKNLIN